MERIPTNLRTLLILEALGQSDRAMTATELNERIGLPKQTVHRLCATLENAGFLVRLGKTKRYLAARRTRDFAKGLLHSTHHHISRRQILNELSRQMRETVNFVVPDGDGMSYLDRVEADWTFKVQLPIGTHVPYHCTASGKCYLASLAPAARRKVVGALTLERLTEATHTTPQTLLAELDEVAARGFAIDAEEFVEGMVAIAVPITDAKGRFVAAVASHGPTLRLSVEHLIERKELVFEAARKLREALFEDEDEGVEATGPRVRSL